MPLLLSRMSLSADSIVSASPYFQEKTSKTKGACQIDLLIETRGRTLFLVEMKFRKKIDSSVIKEVQQKIDVLKRPKYYSVRPVLVYEGELDELVESEQFFDRVIKFGELLRC